MTTYLEKHPPARSQFRRPRRATLSGVIVIHTAENTLDVIDADTGAEDVAAFIQRRADPGSYHTLVDSDSQLRLIPFTAEAYGDATGSNPHAIHISFACRTIDWSAMSAKRRRAFIRNGARAAADAARYIEEDRGIRVPARRITRAESDLRTPGFISHAERDPARRSDPGRDFPWDMFLEEFAKAMQTEATWAERRKARRKIKRADKNLANALDYMEAEGIKGRQKLKRARVFIRRALKKTHRKNEK